MDSKKTPSILDQYFGPTCSIIWFFTKNSSGKDISTNAITHLRPIDYICLNDRPDVLEAWKWAQSVFNYKEEQKILYKDFATDDEKRNFLRELFKNFSGENFVIFPFKTDYVLNEEASIFKIRVCNDDMFVLPDKRWIHPTIPTSPHSSDIFKEKFPKDLITMNKGYTCYSLEEIIEAKKLLDEQNCKHGMIIKNAFTSAGKRIYSFKTDKEFEDLLQVVKFKTIKSRKYEPAYIIEEIIGSEDAARECITPIVHFLGNTICPGVYHQNVKNFKYLGMNSSEPKKVIADKCVEIGNILSQSLNLFGPWGIDFVVDENDYPYPIDINVGRMCGSHYFRFFISLFAPGKSFDSWKLGKLNKNINELQIELVKCGIQFDFVKQKGVIPVRIMDPGKLTILIVGDNMEEILEIKSKCDFQSFIIKKEVKEVVKD